MLPAEAQRFAAGDQHLEVWRRSDHGGHLGRCLHDVFEVVQEQQKPAVPQRLGEDLYRGRLGAQANAQPLRDGPADLRGIAKRGQVHENHAVGKCPGDGGGSLYPQAGLPDPGGARERHHPHILAQ